MVDAVVDVAVDRGQRATELGWCWGFVGSDERANEPVVDLGVEDRHALSVGGEVVGVGSGTSGDQAVEAESREVVAGLVDGVGDAEQMAHLGTQAPIGESEGVESHTQGAELGHDPEDLRTGVRATSCHPG